MFIIFKVKSILQPDPEGPPDPGGHSSAVKEVFKDEGWAFELYALVQY